ncbi:hypothetical protein [Nakamurella endophytica]|uniref:Uncharacterized protein n=1 Tax=Nakamurella endophytica TaxID=1748367 RepID=A0A917SVZ0_9ACTN|nr:hypothetical protein [Nakamurella endophytica]GGL98157.1 hypothetical protein GCM10011594_17580 [Nakamurella endophytica]
MSSSASSTSAAASITQPSSTAAQTSGTAGSTAATPSSAAAPSEGQSSGSDPSATASRSGSGSASTTVGGTTTALDARSTAWFEQACTGLAPLTRLDDEFSKISAGATSTPKGKQQALAAFATLLRTTGAGLVQAGQKLGSLPAPTFEGGSKLAATASQGLTRTGQAFTKYGQQFSTLDVNDAAAGRQILGNLQKTTEEAGKALQGLDLSPEVSRAVARIPACASLS